MADIKDKVITVESLKMVYDLLNDGLTDVNTLLKRIAPYNLLDNSDFTNPVNQRGATSYTGNKYTIDRWKSNSGYSVVTINDDSLNLKSGNGNTVYLQQFIESKAIKSGCEYTVACTLKDGSVHTATGIASTDMSEAIRYIYVNEVNLGNIRFKYDSYYGLYLVMLSTSRTDGIDIVNVALYEGDYDDDTLPMYCPKGYGAELLECQRYFNRIKSEKGATTHIGLALCGTTTAASAIINISTSLRAEPKVSIANSVILRKGSLDVTVTGIEFNSYSNNAIYVNLNTGGSLTVDDIYMVRLVGGYIDINAELVD